MHRIAVLLPATAYRAEDFIRAARAERVDAVVVSDHAPTLPDTLAAGFVQVDFGNPAAAADAIVAAAGPLDAVIAADDAGVMTAALVAGRLGLPHNPPDAVAASLDKAAARQLWATAGVTQPKFAVLARDESAEQVALSFPVVVKPLDRSASQGVIRADDRAELDAAVERVRTIVGPAPLLVEEYIDGPEYAVDGLLDASGFTPLAVFDKPDQPSGPFFEETLLVTPARVLPTNRQLLLEATEAAGRALGLRHGPVHAEFRHPAEDAPHIIEIAARSIGGLCGRSLRFSILGTSLESVLMKHALGRPTVSLDPRSPASGVLMLPIRDGGRLVSVGGIHSAEAIEGVVAVEIAAPPGTVLSPLPDGDRYLGFVFARGPTPHRVEAALRAAEARLDVTWER